MCTETCRKVPKYVVPMTRAQDTDTYSLPAYNSVHASLQVRFETPISFFLFRKQTSTSEVALSMGFALCYKSFLRSPCFFSQEPIFFEGVLLLCANCCFSEFFECIKHTIKMYGIIQVLKEYDLFCKYFHLADLLRLGRNNKPQPNQEGQKARKCNIMCRGRSYFRTNFKPIYPQATFLLTASKFNFFELISSPYSEKKYFNLDSSPNLLRMISLLGTI